MTDRLPYACNPLKIRRLSLAFAVASVLFWLPTGVAVRAAGAAAPTVAAAIPDTTVAEDNASIDNYRDLNAVFSDIEDGGALNFAIQSNSNPGLVTAAIDADSALDLSFTPELSGSATIVVRATDSEVLSVDDTLVVTVTPVNDPPTVALAIPDTSVAEDNPLIDNYRDLNDVFTDIEDGSALDFAIQSNSNPGLVTAVIDADSALDFTFMPDRYGTATIIVRATDAGALSVDDTLVVTVTPVNDPPTVALAIPDTSVAEDNPLIDNYRDLNDVFTDIEDGSALDFTIQSNSNPGLVTAAIDADSALDFTFMPDQYGTATIVVRATDSGALSVDDTLVVTVTPVNDPPTVALAMPDTSVAEDTPTFAHRDMNAVFSDIEDGGALNFAIQSNSNPGLVTAVIDADSALSLSFAPELSGNATIVVRATDAGALSVDDTLVVTVTPVNDPPVVAAAIPDTLVLENSGPVANYRLLTDVFFDVEEGTALSFAVQSNSNPGLVGVVIDADSALDFTFTPKQYGSATIVIRASDSEPLFVDETFVVTVHHTLWRIKADGTGDAPTIQAGINATIDGDTVLLADGVYTGPGNRDMQLNGKEILLTSENGPELTVIDCQGQERGFEINDGEGPTLIIRNLTVRNGVNNNGAGFHIDGASPTVTGNIIAGCSANKGGAINIEGGGTPLIRGNVLIGNTAASEGGGIYTNLSSPAIEDNTLVENGAPSGGGMYFKNSSNPSASNTIVAFGTQGPGLSCVNGANPTISCSNIYGNAGGDALCGTDGGGNISADPEFCGPTGSEIVTIMNTSPCAPANNSCGVLIGASPVACSAPVVASAIPDTTVLEDSAPLNNYRDLNDVFFDAQDGGALDFVIQSNSNPGLVTATIDADSALDFDFAPELGGSATIVIRATDSGFSSVDDTVVVTVTPVNDPPVVVSAIPDTTVQEDAPAFAHRDLNDVFSDIEDGSALDFSIQSNSTPGLVTATVDADSVLSMSIAPDLSGSATIVIRATDTGALSVDDTLIVTVTPVNDPPTVVTAIPDTSIAEDAPTFVLRDLNDIFFDIEDGGALDFAIESNTNTALVVANIDADSALSLSLAPDLSGNATIVVRATDSGALTVDDTLVVTVTPVNDPPTVASAIPDTSVAEDNAVLDNYRDLNDVFSDVEEGSALSFVVQGNTNPVLVTATIDADSALDISFTPELAGSASIVIRAIDSGALSVDDTLVVTVTPVNDPPAVVSEIPDIAVAESSPPIQNYRDLNDVFSDVEEGSALSFVVQGNTNPALVNATIDADSALDLSFTPLSNGNATIVIRATDSGTLFAEDTLVVTVIEATLSVSATRLWSTPVRPADPAQPLFRLNLANSAAAPETLTTIVFTNASNGAGDQTQLDGNFTPLTLFAEGGAGVLPGGSVNPAVASFASGRLSFENLEAKVPASGTLVLVVAGSASLTARDGDNLDLSLEAATDLTFARPVDVVASWPVNPDDAFVVDGFVARQITVHPVGAATFAAGSERNLTLDVTLPPNGYEIDVLNRLDVTNIGTAVNGIDVAAVEAWADDGNGAFDESRDFPLGVFSYTGSRWELTGLSRTVPLGGLRVFVTVDISQSASEGRTIRLSLPTLPDVGVGMDSGNDGPIDAAAANPFAQSVISGESVVLNAVSLAGTVVNPGESGVLLLHLVATNNYTVPKQVTRLNFANGVLPKAPASQADLDGEIELLELRLDANDNGFLEDPATDPVVGTAFFSAGQANFNGLSWNLPVDASRHLFLTADVSATRARDGDVLGAYVNGVFDVDFADPTAVVAAWPLDSDPQLPIDGSLAAQFTVLDVVPATLAPNDGPILALDMILPGNGYADDVLNGLELVNLGTASATDVSDLRLWRDGGDGLFSAGTGDDIEISPLVWTGGAWKTPVLNEPLPAMGTRVFVGLTVEAAPTDSVTVRLSVPVDGVIVASDNDGPIDTEVSCAQSLLLSSRPLLATLAASPALSIVGQNVTVRMIARNVGGERINGVTPSLLSIVGEAGFVLSSGPSPSTFDLAAAAADTFTWVYTSTSKGLARWEGNCQGTDAGSGLTRTALGSASNAHEVFEEAGDLDLFAVTSMPAKIARGQTDVIPLSLTFSASGATGTSNARVLGLRLSLEDGLGNGVIPADLLSQVTVSEGNTIYLTKTSLEPSGSILDLTLATPVVVTPTESATLSIRLDILPTTVVQNFRVVVQSAGWIDATDAISGAPVAVSLLQGTFPISSSLGQLVVPPTELRVSAPASPTQRVGWQQDDVTLIALRLESPGIDGLTTDVAVASIAVEVTDTNDVAVTSPSRLFEQLRLESPLGGVFSVNKLDESDSSVVTLALSPFAKVAANSPFELFLSAEVADSAGAGAYRLRLADAIMFDARDANTLARVPVLYQSTPVAGGIVVIEAPAESLVVEGFADFPEAIAIGESDVPVITAILHHAGVPGVGRTRVDELTLRCQNEHRDPLVPSIYINRLGLFAGGAEIASVSAIPTSGDAIVVPLPGLLLEPGQSDTLEVRINVSATAPQSFLEILVHDTGVVAVDANTGSGVAIAPRPGSTLPLTSGLTQLLAPATELVVGMDNRMPAVLAAGTIDLHVADVSVLNTASLGSRSIMLERLVVRAADRDFKTIAIGKAATRVKAYMNGNLVGVSDSLTADSTTACVSFNAALSIPPQDEQTLVLRTDLRQSVGAKSVRLGFGDTDVGVDQPASVLLKVRIEPEPGRSFPLWTEAGGFAGLNLGESFSNFPNPFAAGRQSTTFVYYLPHRGDVTLKLWTVRGEPVATIRENAARSAGLYQDDLWNGRNGRGTAVVNGVYIAELVVRYDNGKAERLLRKVAVVR